METLHCIKTSRTVRKFTDEPVPWEKIAALVEAARHAPSAGNLQNWKIVIVHKEVKEIANACTDQPWVGEVQYLLLVFGEPKQAERLYGPRGKYYTVQNCAAVVQNVLLEAHAEGLGAAWIGDFDEERVRDVVNHHEDAELQAIVAVGMPDEKPAVPDKKRLETMVFFERWGSRRRFAPYGWQSLNTPGAVKNAKKYVDRVARKVREKVESVKKTHK